MSIKKNRQLAGWVRCTTTAVGIKVSIDRLYLTVVSKDKVSANLVSREQVRKRRGSGIGPNVSKNAVRLVATVVFSKRLSLPFIAKVFESSSETTRHSGWQSCSLLSGHFASKQVC
jgi:hypothetical protein